MKEIFLLLGFNCIILILIIKLLGWCIGKAKYTCYDCEFDVYDPDDPDWKECAAGTVKEKLFEKYDDSQLPQHCGCFRLKRPAQTVSREKVKKN